MFKFPLNPSASNDGDDDDDGRILITQLIFFLFEEQILKVHYKLIFFYIEQIE